MRSVIRWHNAVIPKVVAGRNTLRLVYSALRASWEDHRAARRDHEERQRAAAITRHGLAPATTTEGLLSDPNGAPYTLEAIIAADQAATATTPQRRLPVLREVNASQTAQNADQAEIDALRRTLLRRAAIAAAVTVPLAIAGGWAAAIYATPALGYAAFALRGALTAHRTAYTQQVRVLVESILERGQFNLDVIRRLEHVIDKYAYLDRATQQRLAEYQAISEQFLVDAYAIATLPLQPGESVADRTQVGLKEFSLFLDRASSALGAQAQSFHGLNPQGGLLGRLTNTALAATFVVNLGVHFAALFTTGGLEWWTNAVYAFSDLLFLAQSGASATTGWAGWDIGAHPFIRKLVHRFALPVVTAANVLLTLQLAVVEHSYVAIPAIVLTAATGYLSALGIDAERRLGRQVPRRGAGANALLATSLVAFGLIGVGPEAWPAAAATAAGGIGLMWA
ncbi:MAG: hypothetical protein ACRDXB_03520, partial [Actinomycetes bacterium]